MTPLLTLKLCFLLPTSAAKNPLENRDWNVPGISSAQVGRRDWQDAKELLSYLGGNEKEGFTPGASPQPSACHNLRRGEKGGQGLRSEQCPHRNARLQQLRVGLFSWGHLPKLGMGPACSYISPIRVCACSHHAIPGRILFCTRWLNMAIHSDIPSYKNFPNVFN